jgi:hypothetical protein
MQRSRGVARACAGKGPSLAGMHTAEIAAAAALGCGFGNWELKRICGGWLGTPRGQREGWRCA